MDGWGYLGDDWQNPAVEINLNPLGAEEGVAVGKKKLKQPTSAAKVAQAIKRPMTGGEKQTLQTLGRQKAAEAVRELLTKGPQVVPTAAKQAMLSKMAANPIAAAAALAKPLVAKQKAQVMAQANQAISQQKKQATAAVKDVKEKLQAAVKSGAMSPALARATMASKLKEIQAENKTAMDNIKATAKGKAGNILGTQAKVQEALIQKSEIAADQAQQKTEAEIRSVSASAMPAGAKAEVLKSLKNRSARIGLAKKELNKRKEVATVAQMAAKGVLPKAQADKLAKTITKKADAIKSKGSALAAKAANAEKMTGRLYVLGKWIQAYESAIRFAEQAGSTSVVIPIGDMKLQSKAAVAATPAATITSQKVGWLGGSSARLGYLGAAAKKAKTTATLPTTGTTKEVRMPVQTAKVNLEKFKMEYKKIESQLQGQAGQPGLPLPKIIPVTQTGQPVTPEMLTSQVAYVRQQIATGKVNPLRGAKAIKYLTQINTIMKDANKPVLAKKKTNGSMTVQVFIAPDSMKYLRSGERTVTTPGGAAKTKATLPKEKLPSAIPHATARTKGTMAQTVTTQPTRPPAVAPAVQPAQASPAAKMVGSAVTSAPPTIPATSIQKPGTITPSIKRGQFQRKPRSFAPFKKISLTEIINQLLPPVPQLKKR